MASAFQGAEGFGADATGGRGGKVVIVTNSNDSGIGSLRWALTEVSGPRTVVFDVNQVNLNNNIAISNGDVTIAGQTAGGVEITGAGFNIRDDNVIMRGMILRPGDGSGERPDLRDGITIGTSSRSVSNIIIDQNSFEWGVDENVSFIGQAKYVTFSNNIVAQGLSDSIHPKGEHSKGLLIHGYNNSHITINDNLLAYNVDRNPWIKQGTNIELINNYIFSPGYQDRTILIGNNSGSVHPDMNVNVLGNVIEAGPETKKTDEQPIELTNEGNDKIYLKDNLLIDKDGKSTQAGVRGDDTADVVSQSAFFGSGLGVISSSQVKASVLANVGANPDDPDRVDSRILSDVASGNGGFIDSPREMGGHARTSYTASKDSDRDGMPDWFEDQHGLAKNQFGANNDHDQDGYTDLEEYINGLFTGFSSSGGTSTPEQPEPLSTPPSLQDNSIESDGKSDVFGTPESDVFVLEPSVLDKPVRINEFDINEDKVNFTQLLDVAAAYTDAEFSNFIKSDYNSASKDALISVDVNGARDGEDFQFVAILEDIGVANALDASNVFI
jgi:hypothetical protein